MRINLQTSEGLIVVGVYLDEPITAGNFCAGMDGKRFDGATFYRASRCPMRRSSG